MRSIALMLTLLLVAPVLSGCFGGGEGGEEESGSIFYFEQGEIPSTTWYHYPGSVASPFAVDATDFDAVVAANITSNLTGMSTPFFTEATYYGTGYDTFEPTIGITSSGAIFFTNWNGLGDGTHIIRSRDLGQTWEDVGPFGMSDDQGQTPNSNDPYLYVDKFSDRLVKFDMHALTMMFVEYSTDDGETWSAPFPVEGYYAPQDHQSIASMPHSNAIVGDVVYVYCINTGSPALGAQCSRSLDGGHSWDPQRIGYPTESFGNQCSGLHGHVAGGSDGSIYRGNPSCEGPAVYASHDGGYTWSEHTITTEVPMQQGWHSHEVAVAVDEGGNVHATWISIDQMPWYAYSRDRGETWSEPMMVAAPNVTETGFPTIFAGEEGRVVLGYIGEVNDCETTGNNTTEGNNSVCGWGGYMAIMTDAFAENPLITSVVVNLPEDPLDITSDCGNVRCGGFGDFIDVELDDNGRPWIALAHNAAGTEEAVIGTLMTGPSLYGEVGQLPILAAGGVSSLKM
ncbi:MAG: sialidase family protein [Candidatus Thermoplasmatota archaeon]|nr:sialidase family protein [Candidatus Thermoplasmatota archaeon]